MKVWTDLPRWCYFMIFFVSCLFTFFSNFIFSDLYLVYSRYICNASVCKLCKVSLYVLYNLANIPIAKRMWEFFNFFPFIKNLHWLVALYSSSVGETQLPKYEKFFNFYWDTLYKYVTKQPLLLLKNVKRQNPKFESWF